jgi:catechol 2,3-dioxygenase-like lactoylglutathione lyase family enzyme
MSDHTPTDPPQGTSNALPGTLDLGAFSVSLAVADLTASREFYERLGFVVTGGATEENYLILKNAETTIGLFHGMFDANILTFSPGLAPTMERLDEFTDVRRIQEHLDKAGVELTQRVDPETSGPGHITLTDPDGNQILIDQFF